MEDFYKKMFDLRNRNAALGADAFYAKLTTSADPNIFCYMRQKGANKVVVALNLTGQTQNFTIKGPITGLLTSVTGKKINLTESTTIQLEPWGFGIWERIDKLHDLYKD